MKNAPALLNQPRARHRGIGSMKKQFTTKTCRICGVEFQPKRPTQALCSRQCSAANGSRVASDTVDQWAKRLPQTTTAGYVRVWDALRRKYVYEHRLVMERYIGRSLRRGEVVHHINENRSDNRVDNLVLCTSVSEHIRKFHPHWGLGKKKPWATRPLVPCPVCGTPFKDTMIHGKRQQTCSVACGHIHKPNSERHPR